MPPKSNSRKTDTYPYQLPAFPNLDAGLPKTVDPFHVNLFLSIEAFMRNKKVSQDYRAGRRQDSALLSPRPFPMPWDVLKGKHHFLLSKKSTELERVDVVNLSGPLTASPKTFLGELATSGRTISIDPNPCYLYLRINVAYPPTTIWKAIEPLLTQRRKELPTKDRKWASRWQKPHDVRTWINYFKCYDLKKEHPNLSFGEIGKEVYPDKKSALRYRLAQTAVQRATEKITNPELFFA